MFEALTAIGQIRDVLATAYNAAKKASNAEMLLRIAEAQTAAADLQTEVSRLKDENRLLREQSDIRSRLAFRDPHYFLDSDGPFCSRCWDVDAKLVRMHQGEYFTNCPECTRAR